MRKGRKIVVIAIILFILSGFLLMSWYKYRYSIEPARVFEVNMPAFEHHLLIASQGSGFKDAVVEQVVEALKPDSIYIKVIDVSTLPEVNEKDWSAIVILHTWENWRPQKDADHIC